MKRVAVCIPSYKEGDGIRATVASVLATTYPRELVQVIVAVDGGDAATVSAAEATGARVVVVTPNQGSYAARNAAAEAAGEVDALLFTDADCLVSPGWIEAHLAALEQSPLSGGGVRFTFVGDPPRPAEWIDAQRHLKQESYVKAGFAATCNLAVDRAVFDSLRFDPSLRTGGDREFGARAAAAGHAITYTPDASIDHPARPTTKELLHKIERVASGASLHLDQLASGPRATPRPRRHLVRLAQRAGYEVGPLWQMRTVVLDYRVRRIVERQIALAIKQR